MLIRWPTLRNPVVLVHGLGAKAGKGRLNYFHDIPERLRVAGNRIMLADLRMWHSIESRGEQLRRQLVDFYPNEPVHIIGHSMGGIDARYALACLDIESRIASITTIGSPNSGTPLVDWLLDSAPATLHRVADRLVNSLGWSNEGLRQMGSSYFRESLADKLHYDGPVARFSISSAITRKRQALPQFWLTHGALRSVEGANDGFVSVESARFGEYLGTYVGDHWAQIGQIMGRTRGLDYRALMGDVLARLKRLEEEQ